MKPDEQPPTTPPPPDGGGAENEGERPATEDRPTLVPDIDLEALAKLGPEAFAHRDNGLPADLLASLAPPPGRPSAFPGNPSIRASVPPVAMPPRPTGLPGAPASPMAPTAPRISVAPAAFDPFELDSIDFAFEEELGSSVDHERERPTSRPPSDPRVPNGASAGDSLGPLEAEITREAPALSPVDALFDTIDEPDFMTEPPDAPATDAPPQFLDTPTDDSSEPHVDDLFAGIIDEPFPPSMADVMAKPPSDAPIPAASEPNDEIFDLDADETMQKLRERFAAKDYPGALHLADTLVGDALHADEVAEISARCRSAMQARYVERIGSLSKVPIITVPMSVIRDLPIDNRAGFILSRIDGLSSLEMILDMCGMSELDALRIVYDLVQNGALEFI